MGELLDEIRKIAYKVHVYLGNGYLEKVYENCLRHRLEKAGHKVEAQKNLKVYDEDGYEIGDYYADLVVDDKVIIELKSVKTIAPEHYAQILNYLKITGFGSGLLINFGSYKFEVRTVVPKFDGSVEDSFYNSTTLHG
ncbi:MAG: GxxExxY protein [Kiritimatiellae bacterium]|nr:GxxExxY protein [Kiritimatiellia bacterium]